jgi:type III secretion protein D
MDMTQPVMPLQLRVLAGLHEGAVVALTEQGLALAAGGQADVLLRDAPAQATMSLADGVWTWREAGFEQALQSGQAWRWGPVVLALAAADQPWPDALPPLAFDRQSFEAPVLPDEAPAPEASAQDDDAHLAAAGAEASPPLLADVAESDGLAQQRPARAAARPWRWLLLALLCIVLILGGLAALLLSAGGPAPQPVAAAPSASSGPVNLARIDRAIAELGLQGSVKARVREDGRLMLRGVVADNEALEALIGAVARETRRYTPLLLTQVEFEARARALQPNLPAGIEASPEPGGLLVLLGKRDDVDWVLARQLVDSELPEVVTVDHRPVVTPQAVSEWREARQALRQAAAATAKPPQPPVAASAGEAAVTTVTTVAPVQPLVAAPVPMPPLPVIHAVVGGPRPYLVLGDGSKWLPGGKINALILASIDNEQIVFEDAQGRTFKKPR